jgi:hypothetical protein
MLRYLLLYAAGLDGFDAKALAAVISSQRQVLVKVRMIEHPEIFLAAPE